MLEITWGSLIYFSDHLYILLARKTFGKPLYYLYK